MIKLRKSNFKPTRSKKKIFTASHYQKFPFYFTKLFKITFVMVKYLSRPTPGFLKSSDAFPLPITSAISPSPHSRLQARWGQSTSRLKRAVLIPSMVSIFIHSPSSLHSPPRLVLFPSFDVFVPHVLPTTAPGMFVAGLCV